MLVVGMAEKEKISKSILFCKVKIVKTSTLIEFKAPYNSKKSVRKL